MAKASEWASFLTLRGWIDADGKIIAPGDSILKILLPEGRSFTIRGGKVSQPISIVGEFLLVQESNVDTSGRSRLTAVPLSAVLGIETLA